MSKERKIRKLIQAENAEGKQRCIAILMQQEREIERLEREADPNGNKKAFPWKRFSAVAVSACLVIGIGVIALVKLLPTSPASPSEENKPRYCDSSQYTAIEVDKTLKEYNEDLLYFDWYTQTDFIQNLAYQLNDTHEIICYQEILTDINTGYLITLYVTDDNTTLELLNRYEALQNSTQVQEIEVFWSCNTYNTFSCFEYEDHRYYLEVSDSIDENYILDLTEQLLS